MSYNANRPRPTTKSSGTKSKAKSSSAPSARDKYRYVNVQKPNNSESTKSELQDWARRAREQWDQRNVRFQRDQDLFNFVQPGEASSWSRDQSDWMILNDPRVVVKKLARIIARHPSTLEVTPNGPENTEIAQRIENYCYAVDQAVNHRWSSGLNNPYRYDQAFFSVLRGWLCERILLFPEGEPDMSVDPAALYDDQLFDAAMVYPFAASGEITRVNHEYLATVETIREDPLMYLADDAAIKYLEDRQATERLTVQALYWKAGDGGWYNAVLVGSEWLKEPAEIGYNPWLITITNGASFRATPWDDQDYLKHIGTGILDENSETYKQLNRAATKLNALLSIEANPPVTLFTADGKSQKVDFRPGARMFLTLKDRVEAHRVGPNVGDFKLLWDMINDRKQRGDLPDAFFAEFGGESSAAHTVAMSAGRDVLYPFTEALNMHDQQRYHKMLVLYRDLGPGKPLKARSQPNALGIASSSEITAQDLEVQGCYVEVTRADMTPQEMAARLNIGMALADKKVISLRELRGRNWVGLRNPDRENMQVLAEQVYLNEEVVKSLIPVALEGTGAPALAALLAGLQNGMPAPGSAATPNGVPGQPGPAPAPPGLPAGVLPPILQSGNPAMNNNAPPDIAAFNQLAGLMPAPAFGGAGMAGGIPPAPGPPNLPPMPIPPPGGAPIF